MNDGLLIVRLVFGLMMAAHGAQKLFGWFGGHGLAATAGFFDSVGFRPDDSGAHGPILSVPEDARRVVTLASPVLLLDRDRCRDVLFDETYGGYFFPEASPSGHCHNSLAKELILDR